jgi:hypothetical protein
LTIKPTALHAAASAVCLAPITHSKIGSFFDQFQQFALRDVARVLESSSARRHDGLGLTMWRFLD